MLASIKARKRRFAISLTVACSALVVPADAGAFTTSIELLTAPNGLALSEADASVQRVSSDGSRVIFETSEPFSADDTDTKLDVYERSGGTTTLLSDRVQDSADATELAFFEAATRDASAVYFRTAEQIVAGDTDSSLDIYRRMNGNTVLISDDNAAGTDDEIGAAFAGASEDGSRSFFTTTESLSAADTDSSNDIYMRSGGTTTLISDRVAAGADAAINVLPQQSMERTDGVSDDGSRYAFLTTEPLVAADTDSSLDVYVYDVASGTRNLVSDGTAGPDPATSASFVALTPDGDHLVFATTEAISPNDTDSSGDIYVRDAGGPTTLISDREQAGADAALTSGFSSISDDGSVIYWSTAEPVVADDTDSNYDAYRYDTTTGHSTIVSDDLTPGPTDAAVDVLGQSSAADGSWLLMTSDDDLLGLEPGDIEQDYYLAAAGTVRQLTPVGTNDRAFVEAITQDTSRMIIGASDPLVAADGDPDDFDLYLSDGNTLTLLTDRQQPGPDDDFGSYFDGANEALDLVTWDSDGAITAAAEDGGSTDIFQTSITADPTVPPAPGTTTTLPVSVPVSDTTAASASISSLKLDSKGRVSATLGCPAGETRCDFAFELNSARAVIAKSKAKVLKLGKGKSSAAGGANAKLKLKLSSKNFRYIKRKHKLSVKLAVTTTDASGNKASKSKSATLRAPR